MSFFIVVIYSYLLGSIPFGLLFSHLLGFGDIRKIGSGNIGATNALRTGSKKLALLTLIFDVGKGSLAVFLSLLYFSEYAYLSAIIVYLGHVFPVWLKFKGGKGVATYIGFLIGLNFLIGLYFLLTWIIIAWISRYSSLSSLVATLIAPLYFFFVNPNYIIVIFLLYLCLIISLKHRENIKRLMNSSENKIKFSK